MEPNQPCVSYEDFGALGDGVTDDMPAIHAAHEHANAHGLPVRARPDAAYHLGARAITAVIATDTDWNTARFTVDDTRVENHQASLFEVRSLLPPLPLQLDRLTRDQKRIDVRLTQDCHVLVENEHRRRFIRRGSNRNDGVPQQDCFILRCDGTVDAPIDWDYDQITRTEARPIDPTTLTVRGGVFTTIANRMRQEVGYNYWARNIQVTRSNTRIEGLTHYVVGETSVGHPYRGFLAVSDCAYVTLRDCFATGHRIYKTIGRAGVPVSMGSYDYHANNVVHFRMVNCRMNHILDRTRWGVIATNFCKDILLEDCTLSRMDTHMGVSGGYTIRRCTLGYMGVNAIGRGRLTIEDSTLYGHSLVKFRGDYGSTWDGEVVIRNCHWIPACGETHWPHMIGVGNDGMHDFGYPCSMPREVTIDGLTVDDSNHPADYDGLYLFTAPDPAPPDVKANTPAEQRPYPYAPCRRITLRRVNTASGKPWQVSPNTKFAADVTVVESDT